MTISNDVRPSYEARYPTLELVAQGLENHLRDMLSELPRIDAINSRAKSIDRFVLKSKKINDDGSLKYKNPLFQIQDQIGARINVFYLSDVDVVKNHVSKYMKYIEIQDKFPESDSEFGYFGLHFIFKIPEDAIPDSVEVDSVPEFFELQIKTLFQHAWSEAHHDLGYKSVRPLTSDEKRRVAFTAAQAWGADKIFEELAKDLCSNDNSP
ncbi:RelA/SpoT domain-containing protein [Sphingobium sp. Sx8-8]|uniref:GTP pyrophosphokinase n=1 Tax=Sphingobium sp. Sx8-8 TaxID=2933617 RepID=UPI001F5A7B0D|nr:RelA/SpoT domain-containing protein [Sphingobium sp. Sx8-8]